jgi:hypothetical protein
MKLGGMKLGPEKMMFLICFLMMDDFKNNKIILIYFKLKNVLIKHIYLT